MICVFCFAILLTGRIVVLGLVSCSIMIMLIFSIIFSIAVMSVFYPAHSAIPDISQYDPNTTAIWSATAFSNLSSFSP